MTMAAATGLISGGLLMASTPIYADENDAEELQSGHRTSFYPHPENKANSDKTESRFKGHIGEPSSVLSHGYKVSHFRTADASRSHSSIVAPEEDPLPGLAYMAAAGLAGSFVARRRALLLKTLTPVAFASAAGYYFLPHTARNLLGIDQSSSDERTAMHPHTRSHATSHSYTRSSKTPKNELVSKTQSAWNVTEDNTCKLGDKMLVTEENAKDWWNQNTEKVKDSVKASINKTKSWDKSKAGKAGKDEIPRKATDANKDVTQWINDRANTVGRAIEAGTNKADAWRKKHNGSTSSTSTAIQPVKLIGRSEANDAFEQKAWFRRSGAEAPEETYNPDIDRKRWWSSRSRPSADSTTTKYAAAECASRMSTSLDHWSNGEEQGTAKIHEDNNHWLRGTPAHTRLSDDVALDNKDVDRWSSTGEEMGTSRMDDPKYEVMHRHRKLDAYNVLQGSEYWTNGEEIASADIRDSSYYDYPGSYNSASLSRASWWNRHMFSLATDYAAELSAYKDQKDKGTLMREASRASDTYSADISSKLSTQRAELEKKTEEIKARAETDMRQAKAAGEAEIHEKRAVMEKKSIKDLGQRLKRERDAAEHAAADSKSRTYAWEKEQRSTAQKAIKDIQDRLARDMAASEASAAQMKAKAEAWAREQKNKVEMGVEDIHERVLQETAEAEKKAAEAKNALETRIRDEKAKMKQELEERIRMENVKEEKAAADLRSQIQALALEQKIKLEKTAKEREEKLAFEHVQRAAQETKARTET
ncbi:hypothetical protein EDD11_006539 [Mortierella claussenii]|nr:hypothetical protein EDD11_006539 [Mortierella claussenii]